MKISNDLRDKVREILGPTNTRVIEIVLSELEPRRITIIEARLMSSCTVIMMAWDVPLGTQIVWKALGYGSERESFLGRAS